MFLLIRQTHMKCAFVKGGRCHRGGQLCARFWAMGFMRTVPSNPLCVPKRIGILIFPIFQTGKQTWRGLATCQRPQTCWQSQIQTLVYLWVYLRMLNDRRLVGILFWLYLHLADKTVARHHWITLVLGWGFWQFLNIDLQHDMLICLFISEAGQEFCLNGKHLSTSDS